MKATRKDVKNLKLSLAEALKDGRTAQGDAALAIVKKVAQSLRPIAQMEGQFDVTATLDCIIDACDRKDRKDANKYIDVLIKVGKSKLSVPVRLTLEAAFRSSGKVMHMTKDEASKINEIFKTEL